ncbi:bifunctional pantoate--beta-alanine ligase/(d)CMP kinase [Nodosilinea sp. LEGE 07088]|uniref:bifunctional pantoate--beta-alanine ligase/(d)CMP kinase n=1 Tax=Nodosilinea sp. LEGE 07088 TaxID=2777968 RepID=UPI001882EFD9|nr:bifunctional pantoate--beta-alanine ligase/(d)CMP kinase [Nodosilinea sp. LEGE 07088]MBE9136904.1 bifunctional pantoate--beta-alanine ligase/(d)CMP kinase [Nodosilinea sp. LEGE 07088]
MRALKTVEGLARYLAQVRAHSPGEEAATVGLVTTMGNLHQGHLSLIDRARRENAVVVVSIFVNPLQFGPQEDLARYPQTPDHDLRLCEQCAVDAVFMPTPTTLYGSLAPSAADLTQVMPPKEMMAVLCGPYRPGHFEGVATVVTKLLNLVAPDRAYFGYKDAQQLAILRRTARDLNLPGKIVGCPIVRDRNGLALSSRNAYLSADERQQATALYRGLVAAQTLFKAGERQSPALIEAVYQTLAQAPDLRPQYIEVVHPETLHPLQHIDTLGMVAVAAHLGNTRLIDNVLLRDRQPIVAIDGPAGAGKSTVARRVAQRLNLLYLDSGAMYRAVTWLALDQNVDLHDEVAIAELLPGCRLHLAASGDDPAFAAYPSRIWLNDQEVTQLIRSPAVTEQVSLVSAQPTVRQLLLHQQQQYGATGGVVMEGRDIGTVVFPQAELKIFLTASVGERARRRQRDLAAQQQPVADIQALEQAIDERDRNDSNRRVSPLRKADDAVELITDSLTIADVVEKIVALYEERVQGTAMGE